MRILRGLGVVLLALVVLGGAVLVGARFADGPVAVIAGGPLRAGELVREPVSDWGFARDVPEIEFQLLEPPRSRTVWILVHEGEAYIPCGFLDVPLWKQWPYEALRDGRALVRVEGKRYPVRVVKVDDRALREALWRIGSEKYGFAGGEGPPPEDAVWYFHLEPRPVPEEGAAGDS